MVSSRLFDAHALIRSADPARYPFQPLGAPLEPHERESGISHEQLLAALDAGGVERALVVQRSRLYGYDNRYVCDAAAASPRRLQSVCQVDARDPQCARQTRDWIGRCGAAGIRFMEPVRGDNLDWLDSPGARQTWYAACDLGVPVSVHFFGWNRRAGLEALSRLLAQVPPRAVVLDALAGSAVEAGPPDYGIDAPLSSVLARSGTYLKLTGMTLQRLAKAGLPAAGLLARLAAMVGAARLLWGTDVVAPGQSYESSVSRILDASSALAPAEREQFLYGTAAALYPLR